MTLNGADRGERNVCICAFARIDIVLGEKVSDIHTGAMDYIGK